MSKRITSKLPAATLAQRLAALSETQLMDAARQVAADPKGSDALCTSILEALESRLGGSTPAFEAFVAEIYA